MLVPLLKEGRPHWEKKFPKEVWPAFEDFRNFLFLVWQHIGLPEPTPAQYEIAHRLQYGLDSVEFADWVESDPDLTFEGLVERCYSIPRSDIIRAFRGVGKSYITSAYAIWRVMRNPRDEKILVLSATGSKAKEFVDQTKGIIQSMPLLKWLLEGTREKGSRRRDMSDKFDVAGASISQSYSVKAAGIDGQITGSRATVIVADDIEISSNSRTEEARGRIVSTIRSDFGPICKTEHGQGDIIFLGTPQTEESVYNVLVCEMEYDTFTIPCRFPTSDKIEGGSYTLKNEDGREKNILAYYLRAAHERGELDYGQPTDSRFSNEELIQAEAKGKAHFALQYMLDTSLSDAERYPLRQHDFIVMSVNEDKAPISVQWGRHTDRRNIIDDIPNLGFSGDYFMGPLMIDAEWREYEGKVLWVDPAGRGADETSWSIVGQLAGKMFLIKNGAYAGDPAEAMNRIAHDAKRYNVNVIEVEPNFGQGMWIAAFQPILTKVWSGNHNIYDDGETRKSAISAAQENMGGCTVQESEWAKGRKEDRIIDTLEPVMTHHRLVVDETIIRQDQKTEDKDYSLLYQLTHICRERGALKHDDRLESVAGAVNHFMQSMEMDSDAAKTALLKEERDQMIEEFLEDASAPLGITRGKKRAGGNRTEVTQVKV